VDTGALMNPMELIEAVDFATKEALQSVFGDEPIAQLQWDNPCEPSEVEYELEVVLRRKAVRKP
jgi:hypothetical protein